MTASGPVVETGSGKVRGVHEGGVDIFRGIPYGVQQRYRACSPAPAWAGIREGSIFGAVAPQKPLPVVEGYPLGPFDLGGPQSEDCLHLNVWTPSTAGSPRPVMVWIHGGAFTLGSGSTPSTDPATLAAQHDVVVVSINYRLGALGFLNLTPFLPNDGLTPNPGLLDQIAALRWVQENVGAFGGDPANVTVFGVSAGAMCIGALLAAPTAAGLFRRAICQSGAGHNVHSLGASERVAAGVLAQLDLRPSDAKRILDLPTEAIVDAQERYYDVVAMLTRPGPWVGTEPPLGAWSMGYQPVIDGEILPTHPVEAVKAGASSDVDLIVGTMLHDQRASELLDPGVATNRDELAAAVAARIRGEDRVARADAIADAYIKAMPEVPVLRVYSEIETDRVFRVPANRLADAHSSQGGKTYEYLFTWESPLPMLGASHGLDMPFLFDQLAEPGMDTFVGSGPEATALTDAMRTAWTAFARTGDPSGASLGDWPRYTTADPKMMELGHQCTTRAANDEPELAAWDGLL